MQTPWEPLAWTFAALAPSVLAILAGAAARRAVRRHPDRLRGEGVAVAGITLGVVTLVLNGLALFLVRDLMWEERGADSSTLDGYAPAGSPAGPDAAQTDDPAHAAFLQGRWVLDQDPARALEHFNEALSYDPTFGPALLERGRVLIQFRDHRGALQDLDNLLRLEPENAEACRLRARARAEDQDLAGALADWQSYLELEPGGRHVLEARQQIRALEERLQGK